MSIPPPISLDEGWLAVPEGSDEPFAVPSLRRFVPSNAPIRLSRRFDVPPILDVCLSFDLRLAAAPPAVSITINGWPIGTTDSGSFARDVTDAITLEDNVIELNVPGGAEAAFGHLVLRALPCDS